MERRQRNTVLYAADYRVPVDYTPHCNEALPVGAHGRTWVAHCAALALEVPQPHVLVLGRVRQLHLQVGPPPRPSVEAHWHARAGVRLRAGGGERRSRP